LQISTYTTKKMFLKVEGANTRTTFLDHSENLISQSQFSLRMVELVPTFSASAITYFESVFMSRKPIDDGETLPLDRSGHHQIRQYYE
jgi:hypothetical protein